MALRQDSFGELKVPLTWMAVVALIVCGVVGVSILLSDRRETFQTEAYGAARQAVDTVSAPVGGAVAAPGRWTGDLLGWLRSYVAVAHENRRLHKVMAGLQVQADEAVRLRDENERLRAMLGVKTDPPIPMATARIEALLAERAQMQQRLQRMPMVARVFPSDANFLLVEFRDARRALEAGRSAGLLVRDFSAAPGLENCLRISVGTPEQNERLLAALEAL